MVDLGGGLWVNPAHVMLVTASKDQGVGSVVGFVSGLNLAFPDPPDAIAARLKGGPRPTIPFLRPPEASKPAKAARPPSGPRISPPFNLVGVESQ